MFILTLKHTYIKSITQHIVDELSANTRGGVCVDYTGSKLRFAADEKAAVFLRVCEEEVAEGTEFIAHLRGKLEQFFDREHVWNTW
jgi:hypothetical protein